MNDNASHRHIFACLAPVFELFRKDWEVCPCRRCVTGSGLRGFKSPLQAQCLSLCFLPADQNVKLLAATPAPGVFSHDVVCLIINKPSKTVSEPHLNSFLYKCCLGHGVSSQKEIVVKIENQPKLIKNLNAP